MKNHHPITFTTGNIMPLVIVILLILGGIGFYLISVRSPRPLVADNGVDTAQPATVMPTVTENIDPRVTDSTGNDSSGITGATDNQVMTVNIEAGSYYFNPKVINVRKNQKLKIIITSKDMMHNFNLDEFDVKSATAKAGETVSVEFTANKIGQFEYYCAIGNHRKMGQVGTLNVTE